MYDIFLISPKKEFFVKVCTIHANTQPSTLFVLAGVYFFMCLRGQSSIEAGGVQDSFRTYRRSSVYESFRTYRRILHNTVSCVDHLPTGKD